MIHKRVEKKSSKKEYVAPRSDARYARIHIIGRHEPFNARVINEGSSGLLCQVGGRQSPATEWFPYKTASCVATIIK